MSEGKEGARESRLRLSLQSKKRVSDILYHEARQVCNEKVKAFADCAKASGIFVVFKCRQENNAMNECISAHMTQGELKARAVEEAERQKNDPEFQAALKKPPVYGN